MLVLGIESSCDETALALVRDGVLVDAVLASSAEIHALFGGVVPELASREHLRAIGVLYDTLMERTGLAATDIDAVAVSRGPGLLGSLLVGVSFAKGLCLATGARLIGVNHLMGHLLACGLGSELTFPAVGLLVSGGHTNIYRFDAAVTAVQLGRTIDDAAGEAFDKTAKILGLPYPGGRLIDELSARGRATHRFPRPYTDNDNLDFSFSGLKTAVSLYVAEHFTGPLAGIVPVAGEVELASAPQELCDCCASFSQAVVDTLVLKVRRALDRNPDASTLLVAGGVAANSLVRSRMERLMKERGGRLLVPNRSLCTDNAAMIAYAGYLYAASGRHHDLDLVTIPRGMAIPDDMVCEL